jgi:hypothetical protein
MTRFSAFAKVDEFFMRQLFDSISAILAVAKSADW